MSDFINNLKDLYIYSFVEKSNFLISLFSTIWFFYLGAIFSSFITLVSDRIHLKLKDEEYKFSIIKRSYCFSCDTKLDIISIIPIFGWIIRKGKCKFCNENIPVKYLFYEIFIGILFALIPWFVGDNIVKLVWLEILIVVLFFVSLIDLSDNYIFEYIYIPLAFVGLLYSPFEIDVYEKIFSGFLAYISIMVVFIVVPKIIKNSFYDVYAGGDSGLIMAVCCWFSFQNLSVFYFFLFLYSMIHRFIINRNKDELIPLGPSISLSLLSILILSCIYF